MLSQETEILDTRGNVAETETLIEIPLYWISPVWAPQQAQDFHTKSFYTKLNWLAEVYNYKNPEVEGLEAKKKDITTSLKVQNKSNEIQISPVVRDNIKQLEDISNLDNLNKIQWDLKNNVKKKYQKSMA